MTSLPTTRFGPSDAGAALASSPGPLAGTLPYLGILVVVAAFAAVVPRAQMPPTKSAPMSPLETYLFMVFSKR